MRRCDDAARGVRCAARPGRGVSRGRRRPAAGPCHPTAAPVCLARGGRREGRNVFALARCPMFPSVSLRLCVFALKKRAAVAMKREVRGGRPQMRGAATQQRDGGAARHGPLCQSNTGDHAGCHDRACRINEPAYSTTALSPPGCGPGVSGGYCGDRF